MFSFVNTHLDLISIQLFFLYISVRLHFKCTIHRINEHCALNRIHFVIQPLQKHCDHFNSLPVCLCLLWTRFNKTKIYQNKSTLYESAHTNFWLKNTMIAHTESTVRSSTMTTAKQQSLDIFHFWTPRFHLFVYSTTRICLHSSLLHHTSYRIYRIVFVWFSRSSSLSSSFDLFQSQIVWLTLIFEFSNNIFSYFSHSLRFPPLVIVIIIVVVVLFQ